MDECTLRLECLKLASEKLPQPDPGVVVAAAERYWSWLTGPAQSARQPEGTPNKA